MEDYHGKNQIALTCINCRSRRKLWCWRKCYWNAHPALMPNFRKIEAAGQKPVIEDCTRLAPTKTVSQTKYGETQAVSATLTRTMMPANRKIERSSVMKSSLG